MTREIRSNVRVTIGPTTDARVAIEVGDIITIYLTEEEAVDFRANLDEAIKVLKDHCRTHEVERRS